MLQNIFVVFLVSFHFISLVFYLFMYTHTYVCVGLFAPTQPLSMLIFIYFIYESPYA